MSAALTQLQEMFPEVKQRQLERTLQSSGGDVQKAAAALLDARSPPRTESKHQVRHLNANCATVLSAMYSYCVQIADKKRLD